MIYRPSKTIEKTVMPPIVIIAFSAAINAACKKIGIEIDHDTILELTVMGYGALQGFLNFMKHRKR